MLNFHYHPQMQRDNVFGCICLCVCVCLPVCVYVSVRLSVCPLHVLSSESLDVESSFRCMYTFRIPSSRSSMKVFVSKSRLSQQKTQMNLAEYTHSQVVCLQLKCSLVSLIFNNKFLRNILLSFLFNFFILPVFVMMQKKKTISRIDSKVRCMGAHSLYQHFNYMQVCNSFSW